MKAHYTLLPTWILPVIFLLSAFASELGHRPVVGMVFLIIWVGILLGSKKASVSADPEIHLPMILPILGINILAVIFGIAAVVLFGITLLNKLGLL